MDLLKYLDNATNKEHLSHHQQSKVMSDLKEAYECNDWRIVVNRKGVQVSQRKYEVLILKISS
jgi:hypothetical protein